MPINGNTCFEKTVNCQSGKFRLRAIFPAAWKQDCKTIFRELWHFCRTLKEKMITSSDPLHGKTLEMIVQFLVAHYGWEELGNRIRINSFTSNPTIKSSLTFLRKTPWARKKVEELYLRTIAK